MKIPPYKARTVLSLLMIVAVLTGALATFDDSFNWRILPIETVASLIPELLGALAVYLIIDNSIKQLYGISEHPELPLDRFIQKIETATNIFILETFTSLVNDDQRFERFSKAVEQALSKGATVKILLIHPDSEGARQRAEELSQAAKPVKDVAEQIQKTIARFYRLETELSNYVTQNRFIIKLYDAAPSIAMHAWDKKAYVSFFPVNQRSDEAPNLEVSLATVFGRYARSHFEGLWSDDSAKISLPLKSYMLLTLKVGDEQGLFFYMRVRVDNKEVFYACRRFRDALFLRLDKEDEVEITTDKGNFRATCTRVKNRATRDLTIAHLAQAYYWHEDEIKNKLGTEPRVFILERISEQE